MAAAAPPELGKADWEDLGWLQGRWQHSLDDMGLFTVYGDVALFDRGTALRIRRDEHGRIYAWGWVMSMQLTSDRQLVWRRPGDEHLELIAATKTHKSVHDHAHWREWHTKMGTVAWRRIPQELVNLQDRFVKLPPCGLPGLPERVSMFAVPPPADTPASVRPWRLLIYGGCLTIGWPSGDVYARTMVDRLGERGIFAEAIGCGVSAHTSDQLASGMWRRDMYDKMGLRGEGLLRLLKKQGPFDLVLIMVGIADIVRGKTGNSIVEMHRACHKMGARTVAVSIPPSWHDNPDLMIQADLERVKRLDSSFGFVKETSVAKAKATLNKSLLDLAGEPKNYLGHAGHCALYVDTSDTIPCDRDHKHLWEPQDFIHLTASGYQTLGWGVAEQLAPLLETMAAVERGSGAKLEKLAPGGPAEGRVWRVRGGRRKGGLIVRQDKATDSLFHSGRLGNGALLEELELCEDRLRYRKISGDGPDAGWVTISTKTGCVLVERYKGPLEPEGPVEAGQSPSEPDREPGPVELGELAEEEDEAAALEDDVAEAAEPEAEEAAAPVPVALPVAKAVAEVQKLAPSNGRVWRVIGGQTGMGLVVRHGKSKHSMAHTIRVGNGSILEEIELCDDRLHYRMRCGSGPYTGWISTKLNGRRLVEPDDVFQDTLELHGLAGAPKRAAAKAAAKALPAAAAAAAAAPAKAPAAAAAAAAKEPAAAASEEAAPEPDEPGPLTFWRCVFEPRIVLRQHRSTNSAAVGLLEYGEEIVVEGEPVDGWLKVQGWAAYVLSKHEELGTLLVPIGPGFEGGR